MSNVRPHRMISKSWEDRTSDQLVAPEALALIVGASLLTSRFGEWPSFEDAEVLSMNFDRGNYEWVLQTDSWSQLVLPSLSTAFYVFDALYAFEDPRRQASVATIRFDDLVHFDMDGFNHQNPSVGLSLGVQYSEALKKTLLVANWGGTGIQHEVSLLCSSANVVSVVASGVV